MTTFAFLVPKHGRLRILDIPGAPAAAANDINARGEIVGWFDDPLESRKHGFVSREKHSRRSFSTVNAPGCPYTDLTGINDHGIMTGYCIDDPFNPLSPARGFVAWKGAFWFFAASEAVVTIPEGISNDGVVVGYFGGPYDDPKRGFIFDKGAWTFVDYPNAISTALLGIATNRQIVGVASTETRSVAFVYRDGEFTAVTHFDFLYDINAAGSLVGSIGGRAFVWPHWRDR